MAGQRIRPDGENPLILEAHGAVDMMASALDYHGRGLCVVPQRAGAKMPCVRWKPFQDVRPTVDDLTDWFGRCFTGAGIAFILGPVSGVLAVDVDGPDAHDALVARLGGVPEAPTAKSGSMKPNRYHLYFRHPDVPTQATYHPWHPQLEFRGYRGIIIAPPSMHKSGNRYCWADGMSLDDLPLPEVPDAILAALRAKGRTRSVIYPGTSVLEPLTPREEERRARRIAMLADVSQRTRDFLFGHYAQGPGWNANLFRAACDLRGCDYALDDALALLLRGADPWTAQDREAAERTVRSAFSEPRQSARQFASEAAGPQQDARAASPRTTVTVRVRLPRTVAK